MRDLSNVTIAIKTFLRDTHLKNAVAGIQKTMPEVKIAIADDGEPTQEKARLYERLIAEGHTVIQTPFDVGFGRKSNLLASALRTDYMLVGSDDFDFEPIDVRIGIEKLVEVLDWNNDVDIASGRVGNRPYEFDLKDEGFRVTEIPIDFHGKSTGDLWYVACDLTVNYSLIRKEVFEKVRWLDSVKIGGAEHGAFFIKCLRAGFKTVWVPKVNINEQNLRSSDRYRAFRARANNPERPCFDEIGVKEYFLGNGQKDYDAQTVNCH